MNKKTLLYILFLFLPMIIASLGELNFNFSSIRIDAYTADVTLDEQGDMFVTERWDMDYPSPDYWVRFRDIVYSKYNADNPFYQSPTNDATFVEGSASVRIYKNDVELDPGTDFRIGYSWEYDIDDYGQYVACEPASSTCESIFTELYDHNLSDGKIAFVYTYEIDGAVTAYSDIAELNWNLFTYAEGKIATADVTVHLPANSYNAEDIYVWGHSNASGTIDIPGSERIVMHLENVAADDYIEFRILAPKDLFPGIRAANVVLREGLDFAHLSAYEVELAVAQNRRIVIAQVVLYATYAAVVVLALATVYVYRKYDKEYEPRFTAEYYRELPGEETPAEVSYLYYMKKVVDEDVTATLLDLIRRKYVELEYQGQDTTSKDADFTLRLVPERSREGLQPHESFLLEWFFAHVGNGTKVSTAQIESYGKSVGNAERFQSDARQFVRLVRQGGEKHSWFESALSSGKGKAYAFALIPGIMLAAALLTAGAFAIDNTIPAIISGIALIAFLVYVGTIKKRTVEGNESFVKWRAFRKFLTEFGNFKDYPMPSVIVWEQYLVYATALKCADLVMEQLRVRLPLDEEALHQSTYLGLGYGRGGFYYGYMLGRFQHSYTTARSVAQQTIVAANAAKVGSSGHGGGFGGGHSFGGGGGGGRSR